VVTPRALVTARVSGAEGAVVVVEAVSEAAAVVHVSWVLDAPMAAVTIGS